MKKKGLFSYTGSAGKKKRKKGKYEGNYFLMLDVKEQREETNMQ